ncbi:MAG: BREX system Lon protease-like protein BrxL [Fusobacterium sp. JB019]|nr:BREX system Lon protease-like protein BrxL [Fusobacterium sp. JB019]
MELWESKLKENFGSAVVDKQKALNNEVQSLPRYVSEYLLGFFCEDEIEESGLKSMQSYIAEHRVESKEREKAKFRLQDESSFKLIDKFKVKINLKKNKQNTQMEIPSMGINDAEVTSELLKDYPRLMIDGLWGMGEVLYNYDSGQVILKAFKPFQLPDIDVDEFVDARSNFSTDEWINAMISTIGLNCSNYSRREKFILLSRLLPMVENNLFMMEFGHPGTGKTYAYENISSYSRVISGSQVSVPQLFYNLNTRQDGLLVQYDVLLFDEIDKISNKGLGDEVNGKLYQYLESGKFDRGSVEKSSECGMMMVGNLPSGEFNKQDLLSNLLHESNTHTAFLDRLAGIVPGWELDSIKDPKFAFTKNYGFAADYFSEILHKIRRKSYPFVMNRLNIEGASIRDKRAIEKIVSGLIKLAYPNGELTDSELQEITEIAVEYRQFVNDQNFKINRDLTFNKHLKFNLQY